MRANVWKELENYFLILLGTGTYGHCHSVDF